MDSTQIISVSTERVEVTVTSRGSTITSWISNVRSSNSMELIVGLDCEWRPNTTTTMNNRTATIQLCVGIKCLIIQLFYLDTIPQALKDFLGRTDVICVGVDVERDVSKIRGEYGLQCVRVVDIKALAMQKYRFERQPGLKELARAIVGIEIPKPVDVSMSDWQVRALNSSQIEYACVDAYASYRIGAKLLKGV